MKVIVTIKKMYEFLFYYIYKSIEKNDKTAATTSSAMVLATMEALNIIVIYSIVRNFYNFNIFKEIGKPMIVIGFIMLMTLNIILIYYKKRYKRIILKYQNYSDFEHKKNWRITLSYMIISISLVFIVPIILKFL